MASNRGLLYRAHPYLDVSVATDEQPLWSAGLCAEVFRRSLGQDPNILVSEPSHHHRIGIIASSYYSASEPVYKITTLRY